MNHVFSFLTSVKRIGVSAYTSSTRTESAHPFALSSPDGASERIEGSFYGHFEKALHPKARHVMPQVQGLLSPLQASADRVAANKKELMQRAGGAILKAIREYNAEHPREK